MSISGSSDKIPARHNTPEYNSLSHIAYSEIVETDLTKENSKFVAVANKTVAVWNQASIDLTRLDHLVVNKTVVEDLSKGIRPTEEKIVEEILTATKQDPVAAAELTKLLEQTWVTESNRFLLGLKDENIEGTGTNRTLSKVTAKHAVQVEGENFKVVHEALFKVQHIPTSGIMQEEPEVGYVKSKVIISGKLSDLKAHNIRKIDVKLMNTEERDNLDSAKSDGYGPIFYRVKEDYRSMIN